MKMDYLQKRKQRIKQRAMLLTSRPDFQKDVLHLRKKWKIPTKGIKNEGNYRKWQEWLDNETEKYFSDGWPKHRGELLKLKKKGKFKEFESRQEELNNKVPLNEFQQDLWNLVKKYKLPPKWHSGLKQYLMSNSSDTWNVFLGPRIEVSWDEKTKLKSLALLIDEDTTLEDIKAIWPSVQMHQSSLSYKQFKKFQPLKTFERDERAYELQTEGKSLKEIASILSDEDNHEYAYHDVSKFIQRYKEKLDIN